MEHFLKIKPDDKEFDAYCFALDDVSLTVTPASEANSAETAGIRSDGWDNVYATVDTVEAGQGQVEFSYTPRHSYTNFARFIDNAEVEKFDDG